MAIEQNVEFVNSAFVGRVYVKCDSTISATPR